MGALLVEGNPRQEVVDHHQLNDVVSLLLVTATYFGGEIERPLVEQVFREVRAFHIYDGPTEVHKWSIAKRIKRNFLRAT